MGVRKGNSSAYFCVQSSLAQNNASEGKLSLKSQVRGFQRFLDNSELESLAGCFYPWSKRLDQPIGAKIVPVGKNRIGSNNAEPEENHGDVRTSRSRCQPLTQISHINEGSGFDSDKNAA